MFMFTFNFLGKASLPSNFHLYWQCGRVLLSPYLDPLFYIVRPNQNGQRTASLIASDPAHLIVFIGHLDFLFSELPLLKLCLLFLV